MTQCRHTFIVVVVGTCMSVSTARAQPGATDAARAARSGEAAADHERILELERLVRELQQARTEKPSASDASATPPSAPPSSPPPPPLKPRRLDEAEPPFGEFDFSWLNGNNYQPPSLLVTGPLTW